MSWLDNVVVDDRVGSRLEDWWFIDGEPFWYGPNTKASIEIMAATEEAHERAADREKAA